MGNQIWSSRFNALTDEQRLIGAASESQMRINQIKIDQARALEAFRKFNAECNEHIRNCEQSIAMYDKEWAKLHPDISGGITK